MALCHLYLWVDGWPKGVLVTHASLAAYVSAILPHLNLTANYRVFQFAALSFDVPLEEIVPTLKAGATLVLRNEEMSNLYLSFKARTALQITVTDLATGFWLVFPAINERVPFSVLKR